MSTAGGAGEALLHRFALLILAVVKLSTAVFAAEGFRDSERHRFKGKGMRIRGVGYAAGLALVPAAWLSQGRSRPYPAGADLALSVPLLIDAGGNALGIYDEARLDDVVHAGNAAALASLFGAVISPHMRSRERATAATIVFGLVGGVAWEGMEYAGQALGIRKLQLSYADTAADLALDAVGTLVAGVVTWTRWKPTEERPLVDWGEEPPPVTDETKAPTPADDTTAASAP
ncbi:MAG: hypothetical protein ABIZ34_03475 [Candidatus Limnocylindrales bacterium]